MRETLEKSWDLLAPDPAEVRALAEATGVRLLLARLLLNRKVTTPEDVAAFLEPRLAALPDPFQMKGMAAAVERLVAAMEGGEGVCVWGDYDVDGVTSASQLIALFRALEVPVRYFVPDRFVDGYGLAADRIRELAQSGVRLLVTVDCGVSNAAEVALAAELGMDVIVVDHHQVPPELPRAVAVLDPVQEGCAFPFKHLAACGVTFMLMVALRKALRERGWFARRREPDLREWLDLTAIGTVADMVPLVGVNRTLVRYGLAQIARSGRVGVQALCRVADLTPDRITAGRIGFQLGPRINAAGRVAHASAGVELLVAEDASAALEVAQQVDAFNHERRGLQEAVFRAACELADAHPSPDARRAVVLAAEGWHPGVLGIVASKLVERYHRPTILMALEDGRAKGSARSIPGFRLVEHLRRLDGLLERYGGHDHAAGLTLAAERLDAFARAFEDEAREALRPEHLRPRLRLDADVPLALVSHELVQDLRRLEPFGMGNPEPTLLATSVPVLSSRPVGKDGTHLKLTLDAGGHPLDGIAFGLAHAAPERGDRVDLAYAPDVNTWRGEERLQVRIKALRPAA